MTPKPNPDWKRISERKGVIASRDLAEAMRASGCDPAGGKLDLDDAERLTDRAVHA